MQASVFPHEVLPYFSENEREWTSLWFLLIFQALAQFLPTFSQVTLLKMIRMKKIVWKNFIFLDVIKHTVHTYIHTKVLNPMSMTGLLASRFHFLVHSIHARWFLIFCFLNFFLLFQLLRLFSSFSLHLPIIFFDDYQMFYLKKHS